ncbi:MAG: DUF4254 domain-containing protein [Leptospiraceae bacterium]|nr:DUF4254 domain-containing protein [Leptospiraceae bacterium]MCP5500857.1 DUF4254 domain-containing protein [Leptospiraceae bacterium]
MELRAEPIISIFQQSIIDWHKIDTFSKNPFTDNSIENRLYHKNQIDTEQWHTEDIIRKPDLPVDEFIAAKRKIDDLNQKRVDTVEWIDDYITQQFVSISTQANARMNSETPAWLIDRMSILELKIYHMEEQTRRTDVGNEHLKNCQIKLNILLEQRKDLAICLDELMEDLGKGIKYVKVYRQMKMYNDKTLNPALYNTEKK